MVAFDIVSIPTLCLSLSILLAVVALPSADDIQRKMHQQMKASGSSSSSSSSGGNTQHQGKHHPSNRVASNRHNNNNNNDINHNNNDNGGIGSFSGLSLEEQVRLQKDYLAQIQAKGRVQEAIEVANAISILEQQLLMRVQQQQQQSGRYSVVEKLAEKRSSERIVSVEDNRVSKDSTSVVEEEVIVAAEQTTPKGNAFVLQVEQVRMDIASPPSEPHGKSSGHKQQENIPTPGTSESESAVMDLTSQQDEDTMMPSVEPTLPEPLWKQYEDIFVYAGCVAVMAVILLVLSVAVAKKEKTIQGNGCSTPPTTDSPTTRTPRCPNVFQKVWTTSASSKGHRRVPSMTNMSHTLNLASPSTLGSPEDAFESPVLLSDHAFVGLQNRVLSNFEGTGER
eukprot:PhF_6_TR21238/c3_g1_i1/m.30713